MIDKYYIGLDPGTSGGAIAIINPDKSVILHKMPLLPKTGTYNQHDPIALHALLLPYSHKAIAVAESVRFDNRDSTHQTSSEMLVRSHESFVTICAVIDIQVRRMEVSDWRKLVGSFFLGTDEKKICEYTARLYPAIRDQLIVKKKKGEGFIYLHNLSEALLLAHCAKIIDVKNDEYIRKIRSLPPTNRDRPDMHKGKPIS